MKKVLLIEDSPDNWDFVSRRLHKRGYEVFVCEDGEEGLSKAGAVLPDVILLDMNLPVLDGWTVARALKADPKTRKIPIIAMTAHAMAGDREKALSAGCDDYHPKPIDFTKLLEQIKGRVQ